jgi:hypothetical protein
VQIKRGDSVRSDGVILLIEQMSCHEQDSRTGWVLLTGKMLL